MMLPESSVLASSWTGRGKTAFGTRDGRLFKRVAFWNIKFNVLLSQHAHISDNRPKGRPAIVNTLLPHLPNPATRIRKCHQAPETSGLAAVQSHTTRAAMSDIFIDNLMSRKRAQDNTLTHNCRCPGNQYKADSAAQQAFEGALCPQS